MVNKIRIVGSVGSGKTTLARKLALQKGIDMYSLDDVVWSRSSEGDSRNSDEQRDEILGHILLKPSWIIEGSHLGWSMKTFEEADQIIFLHPSLPIRIYRISSRFFKQKRGIEVSSYTPTWRMFGQMFKWTYQYETIYKIQVRDILKKSPENAIEIRDGKELGA